MSKDQGFGQGQGFNNQGQGWNQGQQGNQGWNQGQQGNQGWDQGQQGNQGWNQGQQNNQGWDQGQQGNQGWNQGQQGNQGWNQQGNQGWDQGQQGNQGWNDGNKEWDNNNQGWGNQGWNQGNKHHHDKHHDKHHHDKHHEDKHGKQFIPSPDKKYKISTCLGGGMVLDASGDPKDLNKMILFNYHKSDNQQYSIRMENGKYIIYLIKNGGTLEVPNSTHDIGARIVIGKPNGTPNEKWDIIPVKNQNNKYFIRSFCGMNLDVEEGSIKSCSKVIQFTPHDGTNQQWYIEPI